MTSVSSREKHCERCGCANNNHKFGRCRGQDRDKKQGWIRCKFEWARCSLGTHSSQHRYVDCYRCWKHPGAPPKDFWGTGPDDEFPVFTADELQVPWPSNESSKEPPKAQSTASSHMRNSSIDHLQDDDEEAPIALPTKGKEKAKTVPQPGRSRTMSADSLDPLQDELVEDLMLGFGDMRIEDSGDPVPDDEDGSVPFVEPYYDENGLVRFLFDGVEYITEASSWEKVPREETPDGSDGYLIYTSDGRVSISDLAASRRF